MTVVVDGRTDVEKLRELLLEPEQTHLDFKANIDLTANTHERDWTICREWQEQNCVSRRCCVC